MVTASIRLFASVFHGSLSLAAGTVKWNQGRLLRSSCLCIPTWCGRHFFVWCSCALLWVQAGKTSFANIHAAFIVRFIYEPTMVFRPFLVIVWLCNDSGHKATGCLWRVYRVFRIVDSFLVSNSEKEIWQRPCHTEYIQIVVSSSSDGRIMICFRFCLLEGNDNGSEHIISLIGGRHTVSFKLTHPKCPFSCSSCSDSPTQTWKSGLATAVIKEDTGGETVLRKWMWIR